MQLTGIQFGLLVEMAQQDVFDGDNLLEFGHERIFVKQFTDLEADFGIFIRIKRRNPRFGRTELAVTEAHLLILVKEHMIRHDNLCPV